MYRAFTRIEPSWKLGDFPFVRLGADPALLLPMLRTDRPPGGSATPRHSGRSRLATGGCPMTSRRAGWISTPASAPSRAGCCGELTDALLPVRVERLLIYEFAERLTDRLPGASAADLAWLVRGYRRYPALMLTLERLGINDAAVLKRMVTHAGRVSAVAADTAALEIGLALYQAPLMLVARAHQARALDDRAVRDAGRIAQRDRAVARSATGARSPAGSTPRSCPRLATTPRSEGASAEATVLEAVAGLRAPVERHSRQSR